MYAIVALPYKGYSEMMVSVHDTEQEASAEKQRLQEKHPLWYFRLEMVESIRG
jgi:hypothetical protein